jgi:triacylglycerol lipase
MIEKPCETIYPILLVHGAGFRDNNKLYKYWGRIPENLEKYGAKIYYGGTNAWGSIERNAGIISEKIEEIKKFENIDKVNIVAHSRGGLESRYYICNLDQKDSIASLTTIATPHYGVKILNPFLKLPNSLYRAVSFVVNLFFRLLGDKNPDFYTSSRQLSEKMCRSFNEINKNKENILYQSYASKMNNFLSDPLFSFLYTLIFITDGPNDGLCPVESAQWGISRKILESDGFFGISHAGVVDAYKKKYKNIDIVDEYIGMISNLVKNGC